MKAHGLNPRSRSRRSSKRRSSTAPPSSIRTTGCGCRSATTRRSTNTGTCWSGHRCGTSVCRNAWRSPALTPRRSCAAHAARHPTIEAVAAYVFLTNQDGGVLNDGHAAIAEDRFWLSTADSDMYLWAKGVSAFSGHEVEIATPHVYPMQLQGRGRPRSWSTSSVRRSSTFVTTGGCAARSTASMSSSAYRLRLELGYEVYLLGEARGGELWEILMTAGQHASRPAHPTASAASKAAYSTMRPTSPLTRTHSNLPSTHRVGHRFPRQGRSRRCATKVFVGTWSASSSTALPCRRITSIAGP